MIIIKVPGDYITNNLISYEHITSYSTDRKAVSMNIIELKSFMDDSVKRQDIKVIFENKTVLLKVLKLIKLENI